LQAVKPYIGLLLALTSFCMLLTAAIINGNPHTVAPKAYQYGYRWLAPKGYSFEIMPGIRAVAGDSVTDLYTDDIAVAIKDLQSMLCSPAVESGWVIGRKNQTGTWDGQWVDLQHFQKSDCIKNQA
jgi:hypothetical protein